MPSTSGFSGSVRVTSSKSAHVAKRRPGLVGLCFLRGITHQSLRRARSSRPRGAGRSPSSTRACAPGGRAHPLLPPRLAPAGHPAALRLRADVDGAHVLDAHAEDLLDGLAHLRLVGLGVDAERVLVRGEQRVRLLADDRADQDLAGVHCATPVRCSSALGVRMSRAAPITSATPTLSHARTDTPWMLRKLLAQFASSEPTTIRARPSPKPDSACAAALVDGVSYALGSQMAIEPRSACTDSAARSAFLR